MTEYYTIFLPYSLVLSLNTSRFKRPTLIYLGMALVPIAIKELKPSYFKKLNLLDFYLVKIIITNTFLSTQ